MEEQNSIENAGGTTPPADTGNPSTPPAGTTPPESTGQTTPPDTGNETKQTPDNKDNVGGLVYPAADDTAAVLAFRKSCAYPDDASGYGLPMETDDQKSIMSFIHKCQLDPIAANAVVKNISEIMAADEQERKQAFTDNYNKVVAGWGESKKENESLVNKGMSLMKLNQDNLRGISESIGMEAALSIMMLLGKTQTDHSGVSGGDSEDGGSLLDYISGKRG